MAETKFNKETDLCRVFVEAVPKGWTVYNETGGYDILLVRDEDGFQIGIEAKLKLNAKVICQVAERIGYWYADSAGPDCRAVLIPEYALNEMAGICRRLGLEVITVKHPNERYGDRFRPALPQCHPRHPEWLHHGEEWFEFNHTKRIDLPDYVPDVISGDACPVMLTHWKIAAMKICILLERTGRVTRGDFKALQLSISRWTQGGLLAWLRPSVNRGEYIKGDKFPDFKAQHPKNYGEIEADFDNWNPRVLRKEKI